MYKIAERRNLWERKILQEEFVGTPGSLEQSLRLLIEESVEVSQKQQAEFVTTKLHAPRVGDKMEAESHNALLSPSARQGCGRMQDVGHGRVARHLVYEPIGSHRPEPCAGGSSLFDVKYMVCPAGPRHGRCLT